MITPNTYFKSVVADEDVPVGEVVYVVEVDDKVKFHHEGRTYTTGLDDFLDHYEYDPEGQKHKADKLHRLMAEIDDMKLDASMLTTTPADIQDAACTDLVAIDAAQRKKHEISLVSAKIATFQLQVQEKQSQIEALIDEKKYALQCQMEKLKELVGVFDEAIWTINLYAGVGEEVIRICAGDARPSEEQVAIRQRLLFMDEECALDADKGGIDFESTEKFDAWVSKSANLNRLLPETKGIVALRTRRYLKDYGDVHPFVKARLDKENMRTCFLIRNGQNLYRLITDMNVRMELFPGRSRMEEVFGAVNHAKPGSAAYMMAVKSAEAERRHYMRILLVLQGLFDRTQIFHPLSQPVNLLDRDECSQVFRFIHDAELALPDGHERFTDWMKRVNGELQVGCRVIGTFNSYNNFDSFKERVTPKGARRPDDMALHTIERREAAAFVLMYHRNEEVYGNWYRESHMAKRRASCRVYVDDGFLLNFDAATETEMEFYINSRLDRHNYMGMIPLLTKALELKKKENADEEPFKKMLTGAFIVEYDLDQKGAREAVDELVTWWKFKNKTHRALTSDDVLANNQIVAEYRLRAEREAQLAKQDHSGLIQVVLARYANAILIAHKDGTQWVVLVPHNDENVFVTEALVTWRGGKLIPDSEKEWKLVDRRFERWRVIHKTERFGKERVSYDPNDAEANSTAQYKGYQVLHGRNCSAEEWEQLRRANAIQSAGAKFPTPKPYGDGPMEQVIPESDWTDDMRKAARYSTLIAKELIGRHVTIRMTKAGTNFQACYGAATLTYNLNGGCTKGFFANVGGVEFDDLLIHELGHEYESDHRSENYHQALTRLGAKFKKLALEKPEVFK